MKHDADHISERKHGHRIHDYLQMQAEADAIARVKAEPKNRVFDRVIGCLFVVVLVLYFGGAFK